MTERERLLRYLKREDNSFIPFDIGFNTEAKKFFAHKLQGKTEREYFGCQTREVRPDLMKAKQNYDFARFYPDGIPDNSYIDEWGICTCINEKGLVHVINPMKNFSCIEDLAGYPFPDYTRQECYDDMRKQVEKIKKEGFAAVAKTERLIFAMGRDLRGYENHLMDYYINEDFNEALLDAILKCQIELVRGMASTGADIIWLSSDVASQDNVLLNPEVYHKTIAWRMKELYKAAKAVNPDILCAYHCCGNVVPIMDDIIEFEIEILNPIQPESLNLKEFKSRFGNKLVLWGGISVQHTLTKGTTEDVRQSVRDTIDVLGKGGGFVISPCNEVTEDIPWDNLLAFVDESKKYA